MNLHSSYCLSNSTGPTLSSGVNPITGSEEAKGTRSPAALAGEHVSKHALSLTLLGPVPWHGTYITALGPHWPALRFMATAAKKPARGKNEDENAFSHAVKLAPDLPGASVKCAMPAPGSPGNNLPKVLKKNAPGRNPGA